VAAAAAESLRPVSLELGGKDPLLVFADADADRALAGAVWGSFANCGQICSGAERIYVEAPLYERFAQALAREAAALRLGRGEDPAADVGPLVSEAARARVEELVADAVAGGARVLAGGARADTGLPGWFYEPTVLADVPPGARIEREEIFGPVVTVAPFADEDEAVRLANESSFGLGASVWTRDRARAERVAARLEAGSVWTNDIAYTYATGQASWGGVKESGYGRGHSRHGLYAHTRIKHVDHDRGRLGVPWWYPYSPAGVEGFRGLLAATHAEGLRPRAAAAWRHRHGLLHLAGRLLRR
jgi:acyl-CoA reductase-like NAD-dependent aldehyde dehydrogenase